tara:strand:- start:9081 stop:9398 length:318 start_codon:yes stop_codon:yes gene_type:complete
MKKYSAKERRFKMENGNNTGRVELADKLTTEHDIPHDVALGYVSAILDNMTKIINEQGKLNIRKFGRFSTRNKTERQGRNPKTGEPCSIRSRRVVTFTSSKCIRK